MKKKLIYFYMFCIFLFSCFGRQENKAPVIEIIQSGPEKIGAYRDSIFFRISYFDADGDLGENAPDRFNLFVEDQRSKALNQFRIPQLSPYKSGTTIRGIFSFSIPYAIKTTNEIVEILTYKIWVLDRNQNSSDTVFSAKICITD